MDYLSEGDSKYISNDDSAIQDRLDTEKLLHRKEVLNSLCLAFSISVHSAGIRCVSDKILFFSLSERSLSAQSRGLLRALSGPDQGLRAKSRDTIAVHERKRKRAAS